MIWRGRIAMMRSPLLIVMVLVLAIRLLRLVMPLWLLRHLLRVRSHLPRLIF